MAGLTGANGNVYAVAVRPNGKILIGGNFSVVNGLPRKNFAQINSDGSLDTNFVATSFNSSIFDISVSPDDRIVAAGAFTAIGGMGQHYVARLYGDSPPLNLVPTGPNFFQLFWPSGWTDFTPQQSSGINSGWVSFPPIPTNDGTNWSISFFATNSSQIFRLIR